MQNGRTKQSYPTEAELRLDLAVAFRWAVRFGYHESVANHFSAALPGKPSQFLMNPKWQHFSTIKASDLVVVDLNDGDKARRENIVDPSAFVIHGAIHAACPQARIVLHCHSDYLTALSTLEDPTLYPIDQSSCRFYGRLAYDTQYGGMGNDASEGVRLAGAIGNKTAMIMGNHGVLITGDSTAKAFEDLYYLERAAKTQMLAYASGKPLKIMGPALAQHTADGWDEFEGAADKHFDFMKETLLREEPDVAD